MLDITQETPVLHDCTLCLINNSDHLFHKMLIGICYCKILYHDGKACDYTHIYANPAFESQTGIIDSKDKHISDIFPGFYEMNPDIFNIYERVAEGGPPEAFEKFCCFTKQWFLIQVFSPKREHIIASFINISQRKRLEETLNKIQHDLQHLTEEQDAMLNNELVGIMKVYNQRHIWTNKAMERIFGYTNVEINGQPNRMLYPDDEAYQSVIGAAYPLINTSKAYRNQIELQRKDKNKIWVDINAILLPEEGVSLWIIEDITDAKKYQQQLEYIAHHDILTSLPNRLLFYDRLNQALFLAKRSKKLLAVCYLDLDNFKPVNDNYGHGAGDKVLQEIAGRILAVVRSNDTVGRLGGDEFVMLLTNMDSIEEYPIVLKRLIDSINKPIMLDNLVEVIVGVSIGVALFPPDRDNAEILLRHADQAMYQAKESGCNCVSLFSSEVLGAVEHL